MYQLTQTSSILRTADNALIPADPSNRDYADYLAWVAAGNAPTPLPLPTLDQVKAKKIADLYGSFAGATYADIAFTNAAAVIANYQTDEGSRARVSRALASYTPAGAVPTGFYWVDAANVRQTTTLADLQGLAKAIADREWSLFQHLQTKKADVKAAADIPTVNAVAW